jgi:hypothetical protein
MTKLHIKLLKNGVEKVKLSFPQATLSILEQLMPSHVDKILKERNIDLKKIKILAEQSSYQPQVLLEMKWEETEFLMWLE